MTAYLEQVEMQQAGLLPVNQALFHLKPFGLAWIVQIPVINGYRTIYESRISLSVFLLSNLFFCSRNSASVKVPVLRNCCKCSSITFKASSFLSSDDLIELSIFALWFGLIPNIFPVFVKKTLMKDHSLGNSQITRIIKKTNKIIYWIFVCLWNTT